MTVRRGNESPRRKGDVSQQPTSGFKSFHRKVRLCELFRICVRLQGVTRQAMDEAEVGQASGEAEVGQASGEAEVGQEECQPH